MEWFWREAVQRTGPIGKCWPESGGHCLCKAKALLVGLGKQTVLLRGDLVCS